MTLKKYSLVITLAIFVLAACKKETATDNNNPTGTKIYAAGSIKINGNNVGAYWKNGEVTTLGANAYVNGMAIQGNDVYVVGNISENGKSTACYWKNGTIVKLTDGTLPAVGYAIAINGNDVHVTGTKATEGFIYWKNGISTTFFNTLLISLTTTSIKVYGNDVYITGIISSLGKSEAAYWKNGVLTKLPMGAIANDIVVNGNDIYVGGGVPSSPSSLAISAAYWKNGVLTTLSTTTSSVYSMAINGTDVYAAGLSYIKNGTGAEIGTAVLWKNNNTTLLGDGLTFSSAKSISLNGNDVYVGGHKLFQATYWKNGTAVQLSSSESQIAQIAVVSN